MADPFASLMKVREHYAKTGGPAFPQPHPPKAFERAMAFVDGTNLFHRLSEKRLVVPKLLPILETACSGRELIRAYVYTTAKHRATAMSNHGGSFLGECRVVLGDEIPTKDGNVKEKGVDALLVADLVYHAAAKNCVYAVVLTHDSDFRHALRRVEDFGCRTGLVAVGCEAPERLQAASDDYCFVSAHRLVSLGFAKVIESK